MVELADSWIEPRGSTMASAGNEGGCATSHAAESEWWYLSYGRPLDALRTWAKVR